MSKVHVRKTHALDREQARGRLQGLSDDLSKYGVKLTWKGDKATIKGVGVSGDVQVADDAVDVTLKLGMLAKAAGVKPDRLQSTIGHRLEELLA